MDFRRVPSLPPYVFAVTEQLKLELRRAGEDVVDLGFGNPDLPSPDGRGREAGRGGREAAQPPLLGEPRASRSCAARSATSTGAASASSSIPRRRSSRTIGAKEGLAHLMWVLVEPGDAALVPAPELPDPHLSRRSSPARACIQVALGGPDEDLFANLAEAFDALAAAAACADRLVPAQPDDARSSTSTSCSALGRLRARARGRSSCTTSPTPTSPSTATSRRRSSQVPRRATTSRSSSTR